MKLDMGQTWRNFAGQMVTVIGKCGERFQVRGELGKGLMYSVDNEGHSRTTEGRDLHERVMRVYIAGPMSGYADFNFPAFHAAAKLYRDRGCFVINPAEINGGADEQYITPEEYQAHWAKCMRLDIAALVTCEMIVMLDGWENSKVAMIEHNLAEALGMARVWSV